MMRGLTGSVLPLVDGQVRIALIFGFAEVRQDVLVAPARVSLLLPVVKVTLVATNVEHSIQDRGSPQNLSSGPTAPTVDHGLAGTLLWLGPVNIV